ncbi:hypothetical protein [Photorhabdus heterorhabditis]|uniref:hypothetical protein n=1 Tax=Photorhabdus heterorhabditis TaxID=880156 RepID=UPI001561F9BC|nr:hypothetical protein [Photorhabdus heterorhabditis]NRN28068.1 hypothetical protein [Photorhabdus heterorhabditis subsp. aluminescens]
MIRFKNKLPVRENIVLTRRKFTKIALASIIVVNTFLIIHAHEVKATEAQSLSQISHLNENTITNGIGGRAIINNTGSILITKIALPKIKEGFSFKAEGGTLYVYTRHLLPVIFQVASLLAALTHTGHMVLYDIVLYNIVIYAPGDSLPCRRDPS